MVAAAVVVVSMLSSSCERGVYLAGGRTESGVAHPAMPQALVGTWASDSYETQLGVSTLTICFSADGTFKSLAKTQAGTIKNHGSYTVSGSTVTFTTFEGDTSTATIGWKGADMTLTNEEQQTTRYRRTPESC